MYRGINGMWGHDGFWFFGGWWGLIIATLAVGALIVGVIALRKAGARSASTGRRSLDILEERFANGELDVDTFKSMRTELEGSGK